MKYRKIPVVIEALQFVYTPERIAELKEFCGNAIYNFRKERHMDSKAICYIRTLKNGEGVHQVAHIANEGDFVIRGIQGEFYPCKPDIFEMTYEKVE